MAFREVPFERFVTSCVYHRPFQNPVESVEKGKKEEGVTILGAPMPGST